MIGRCAGAALRLAAAAAVLTALQPAAAPAADAADAAVEDDAARAARVRRSLADLNHLLRYMEHETTRRPAGLPDPMAADPVFEGTEDETLLQRYGLDPSAGDLSTWNEGAVDDLPVRLLVADGRRSVLIGGAGFSVRDERGALLMTGLGEGRRRFAAEGDGIAVDGARIAAERIRIEDTGGRGIEIDGRRYRNRVDLLLKRGAGRALRVINVVPLEDYIRGVITREMPAGWPAEARKAQAVAARTYALYKRSWPADRDYDLGTTILHQVYGGMDAEDAAAHEAVHATWGEVLTFDNRPAAAVFHSTCGGHTVSAGMQWGGRHVPYLLGHPCPYCHESRTFRWEVPLSAEAAARITGLRLGRREAPKLDVRVTRSSISGFALEVAATVGDRTVTIKGADFRRRIDKVLSGRFVIQRRDGGFVVAGRGFGHGVGLCQSGARGMAKLGLDYRRILGFYYPNTRLMRLSSPKPAGVAGR